MFSLLYKKYFNKKTFHIFIVSFVVFIILNVIENVIHYNIGKFHNGNGLNIKVTNPSSGDWFRIIFIMIVFAILQGIFTSYFNICDI